MPDLNFSTASDYRDDPYSAAVHDILEALLNAARNEGAMSEGEKRILDTVQDTLFKLDPHLKEN